MKQKFTTEVIICIMITLILCITSCADSTEKSSNLTFYNVPMVCFAAPEIGCGSLAKPFIVEAQGINEIKDISLNRKGTILAIRWDANKKVEAQEKILKPLFNKYDVEALRIGDNEHIKVLTSSLADEKKWYTGFEIDELSLEEASIIAKDIVQPALTAKLMTKHQAEKIKADITAYFRAELVEVRTPSELCSQDTQERWENAVIAISNKYISSDKTVQAYELYKKNRTERDQQAPSCKKDNKCCNK